MNDQVTAVAEAYRAFARREARGRSAEYESLAESVADDPAVVGFIASLPPDKRQPNLLFAAARYLLDVPFGIQQLRDLIIQSRPELTRVILTRRTQTNEPARCAVLLPAATRPSCTAVTCSPTCPHWQPGRRQAPLWLSTIPPSCTTSPRTGESSSLTQSAA